MPGLTGMYAALTGHTLGMGDLLYTGLATHAVSLDEVAPLQQVMWVDEGEGERRREEGRGERRGGGEGRGEGRRWMRRVAERRGWNWRRRTVEYMSGRAGNASGFSC